MRRSTGCCRSEPRAYPGGEEAIARVNAFGRAGGSAPPQRFRSGRGRPDPALRTDRPLPPPSPAGSRDGRGVSPYEGVCDQP